MGAQAIQGHDEIVRFFTELFQSFPVPEGVQLEIPPRYTREFETRWLEYVPNELLRAEIVAPEKYANVFGVMQGGFLCALFDHVMAPLCFAAAGPTTSIDLATNFLRPVTIGEAVTIEARIRRIGRRAIHLTAEGSNKDGKLVATATGNVITLL